MPCRGGWAAEGGGAEAIATLALGLAWRRRRGAFGVVVGAEGRHAENGAGLSSLPVAPLQNMCGCGAAGTKCARRVRALGIICDIAFEAGGGCAGWHGPSLTLLALGANIRSCSKILMEG